MEGLEEKPEGYEPSIAAEPPADAPMAPADPDSDLSASSTSMARMKMESEREEKRQLHSASFFESRKQEREAQRLQRLKDLQREAIETPAHPEFDPEPELDDFHTPSTERPAPIPEEVGTEEAVERETKRRRQGVGPRDEQASLSFAFKAYEMGDFLQREVEAEFNLKSEYYAKHYIAESEFLCGVERNDFHFQYGCLVEEAYARTSTGASAEAAAGRKKKGRKEIKLNELPEELVQKFNLKYEYYAKHDIAESEFLFGVERNDFHFQYGCLVEEAYARTSTGASTEEAAGTKKMGRKEIKLNELPEELVQNFTGSGGADEKEWAAWMEKGACDVMTEAESGEVFQHKSNSSSRHGVFAPTRTMASWARTSKLKAGWWCRALRTRPWGHFVEMHQPPAPLPSHCD